MTIEKRRKRRRLTELHWSRGPSELRVRHDDSDKEAKTLIRRENDTKTDENIHRVRRKGQISLTMIVKEIHDCSNIRSDARNSTARRMSVVSFLYYLLVVDLITDVVVVIRDIWKASDVIHESRIDLWSILSSPSIMYSFRQRSSLYYSSLHIENCRSSLLDNSTSAWTSVSYLIGFVSSVLLSVFCPWPRTSCNTSKTGPSCWKEVLPYEYDVEHNFFIRNDQFDSSWEGRWRISLITWRFHGRLFPSFPKLIYARTTKWTMSRPTWSCDIRASLISTQSRRSSSRIHCTCLITVDAVAL